MIKSAHDLLWAFMAPVIAILVREGSDLTVEEVAGSQVYIMTSIAAAVISFSLFALHKQLWSYTSLRDIVRIGLAAALSVVLTTFLAFALVRHDGVARTVPFLHFLFLALPISASRVIALLLREWRGSGAGAQTVGAGAFDAQYPRIVPAANQILVVGVNKQAEVFLKTLAQSKGGTAEVVGILDEVESNRGHNLRSIPILGTPAGVDGILKDLEVRGVDINYVVVCEEYSPLSIESKTALEAAKEAHGYELMPMQEVFDPIYDIATSSDQARSLATDDVDDGSSGDLSWEPSPYFKIKPAFDMAVGAVAFVCAAPVMLLVGAVVRLSIGSPLLFWQTRPGLRGQLFRVYKFRTMRPAYDRHGNRLSNEERQTYVCRLLRRSRLDELPQLFNILCGQMSLIGPRPLLPVDQPKARALRLQVRPGVTGWAQVNGGVLLSLEEKLAMDLWYNRHASFGLDMLVLYLSVLTVLRGDRRNSMVIRFALFEMRQLFPAIFDTGSGNDNFEAEVPDTAALAGAAAQSQTGTYSAGIGSVILQ